MIAITHEFRTPLTAIRYPYQYMSDLNFDREQCKDLLSRSTRDAIVSPI